MGHALLYPEPPSAGERGKKGGRGKKKSSSETEELSETKKTFSDALLSAARAVLRHSIELAREDHLAG